MQSYQSRPMQREIFRALCLAFPCPLRRWHIRRVLHAVDAPMPHSLHHSLVLTVTPLQQSTSTYRISRLNTSDISSMNTCPSRATAKPGKTFSRSPSGKKYLNFSFQNGTFWHILYFRAMTPKHRGPGETEPPTLTSQRACMNISSPLHSDSNVDSTA